MGQARGSAYIVAAALVTMAMLFHCGAAAYNVPSWTSPLNNFVINNWVKKTAPFNSYTIYFAYDSKKYNVAKVSSKTNYDKCIAGGADLRQTGADEFKLTPGANFFICTKPGRCAGGMKLTINAI